MDEKVNRSQDVLEKFKKTVEEMAKDAAAQKQNDLEIQMDNLRLEVKDLRQAASRHAGDKIQDAETPDGPAEKAGKKLDKVDKDVDDLGR